MIGDLLVVVEQRPEPLTVRLITHRPLSVARAVETLADALSDTETDGVQVTMLSAHKAILADAA